MGRRAVLAAVLTLAALLAAGSSPATASYVIGPPDVTTDSGSGVGSGPAGLTRLSDLNPGLITAAPDNGVIVTYRARLAQAAPGATEFKFRVLRPQIDNTIRGVGSVTVPAPASAETVVVPAAIPIKANETIGIDQPDGLVIRWRTVAGASNAFIDPVLADGASATSTHDPGSADRQLLINATVEPDRDGDGRGDETQDGCPTDASVQGSCPAAAGQSGPAPSAATVVTRERRAATLRGGTFTVSSTGVVGIPVSCALTEPVPCSGSLSLEVRGAALARVAKATAFRVAPGARRTVRTTLSRKGRALLRRRKRLKARLLAATNTGVVTTTVTLKAPKPKKKPKTRPTGLR